MSAPSKLSWVNCCKKQLRDFTKNVIRTYLIKDQGQLFLQRISYSQIELMSLALGLRTPLCISTLDTNNTLTYIHSSDAGTGEARGATEPPIFGRSVTPTYSNRGRTDYPHLLLLAPPNVLTSRHH